MKKSSWVERREIPERTNPRRKTRQKLTNEYKLEDRDHARLERIDQQTRRTSCLSLAAGVDPGRAHHPTVFGSAEVKLYHRN